MVAVSASIASAAEDSLTAQELSRPLASGKVSASVWSRQNDAYSLQLLVPTFIGKTVSCLRALDPAFGTRTLSTPAVQTQVAPATRALPPMIGDQAPPSAIVNVADALLKLVPQNISTYQPVMVAPAPDAPMVAFVQKKPKVVQVWLLRADGTQILPVSRTEMTCTERVAQSKSLDAAHRFNDEIVYRFPVADSEQAIAAAIRIDDEYYIEKLQPLSAKAAQ
jgi:hypothetical protein